jgi:predicted NAD/FAD-binding protein
MNIAIVGSGISGLYAAYYLSKQHQVTLYEANSYLGGHTDTHNINIDEKVYAIDTGFIVFNEHNYHYFCRFLDDLNVKSQSSNMTFSFADAVSGLEYNATTLDKLFCQRRNILSPRFYRMVSDILRFYREAPALLKSTDDTLTLGDYLHKQKYSQAFIDDHILPMACALWSGSPKMVRDFPVRYFVAFMANHQMLKTDKRPQWRTVCGGSSSYIQEFKRVFKGNIRLACPVQKVERDKSGVVVKTNYSQESYDHLILACHSDQALRLLANPSNQENEILGAMTFQDNDVVLHTDSSLMPKNPKAWASWNALKLNDDKTRCTVTYYMNLLQNLDAPQPLLVTLNCTDQIDPNKILQKRNYHHPVYTVSSLAAQKRRDEINGMNNTWYVGAYWGWGFHEDGAQSAEDVIKRLSEVI